jgi:hypothetical protein
MNVPTKLITAILGIAFAGTGWAQQCTQTSDFMSLACSAEVIDDFWEEFARCRNLVGVSNVQDCWADAQETRMEEAESCEEVRDARNEICDLVGDTAYNPNIDPDNFLSIDDAVANPNPFFPLIPGTTWIFENEDEVITVTVLDETREILGVDCFIVRDLVTEDGESIEDTDDYYAMDVDGNVWYFGEIAQNFEDGFLVDIEGSFTAGVEGAKPGIIMLADPMPGDGYRQEYFLGDAEDAGEVLSLSGDESVEIADCNGQCLVISDINPNEPDVEENKYYVAGIGLILELDLEDGERTELVEIINP